MALKITNECSNCGICEVECPYEAIYPPGESFRKMQNRYFSFCKSKDVKDKFYSDQHYYIIPDRCNECKGISNVPKCLIACPIKGLVHDPEFRESEEHLYAKKEYLDTLYPWKNWN